MSVQGLPEIDVPWFQRDPHDCRRCVHSFYSADDPGLRYLRCSRGQYSQQCRYGRHETGACGHEARFWNERGVS